MIKVNNLQNQQVIRYIVDLIEPFICKVVQRKKHTFFVYRCSDYFDFNHLLKIHLFKLENNYYKELINDYWSAIDLIYLKIKGIPPYSASKKYFDILTSFILKEKEVIDFELFEIKLTRQTKKSNLSIKTHKLMKLLEKNDKKLNFV
nr:hypothetical protein [archaeon]